MAIIMMTGAAHANEPNVRRVDDYSGHETGRVSHGRTCPHANTYDRTGQLQADCITELGSRCFVYGPLYLATTHVGLVLATGERNGYDDSDFTATFWNPETQRPETLVYASTRGWTYPNSASVDATPDVQAAYVAYRESNRLAAIANRKAEEAKTPTVGMQVRVIKGRKVPIGTEGTVAWFGPDKFYQGSRYESGILTTLDRVRLGAFRVGININGAMRFTNASNVEVISA